MLDRPIWASAGKQVAKITRTLSWFKAFGNTLKRESVESLVYCDIVKALLKFSSKVIVNRTSSSLSFALKSVRTNAKASER